MLKNSEFKSIINSIEAAKSIAILPHIIPDGDTLGSSVALNFALKKFNKNAYIILEDHNIPLNLKFLFKDVELLTLDEADLQKVDLLIAIDCSDEGRLGKRKDFFLSSGIRTLNIDHHTTNTNYADINAVNPNASSVGEMIYFLIKEMAVELDEFIAKAIYTSIATDTGSFIYSNTTAQTHRVVADLLEYNVNVNDINIELYQNIRYESLLLRKEAFTSLELYNEGKIGIICVTQEMIRNSGAYMNESDGLVEDVRNIDSVEVAILLKESKYDEIKVGFRAKKDFDVSELAKVFQGGGHKKAAGCLIHNTLREAKKMVLNATKDQIGKIQESSL